MHIVWAEIEIIKGIELKFDYDYDYDYKIVS